MAAAIEPASVASVAALLRQYRYRAMNEEELQRGIGQVLSEAGLWFERERRLGPRDRPDFFLAGGLVIEVKISGRRTTVAEQLLRYAGHEEVRSILLVT